MNANEIAALDLIISNPRNLTVRGHALINANIRALLSAGLVVYAPGRNVGYKEVM